VLKKKSGMLRGTITMILWTVFLACYLIPIIWIVLTSVKPASLIMSYPPKFVFDFTTEHFVRLHTEWRFFGKVWNGFVISSGTTILCIVIGTSGAYAIARYRVGGNFLPIWILSNRFLPLVTVILPLFLFYKYLGLIDTHIGQIFANLLPTLPFAIWLLKGFLAEIPQSLEDAARVDGCGTLGVILRIVLPLVSPAIAVTSLFVFLFSWNQFFIPLALSESRAVPTTVAFMAFRQQFRFDWGAMSAAAMFCLLPLLIMVALLHKHIVRGLTLGAVKG